MSGDLFDYIVYHGGCFDGFTGFYLFLKTDRWAKKPIVYPDQPFAKQPPPDIKGKNIIVIDVAYHPDIVKKIAEKANKLLFIDHHKTHHDEIKALKLKPPHEIVYDIDESGASLVWKRFFGDKKRPKFLEYIRDNDLGLWQMPETNHFVTALDVKFRTDPTKECLKQWDQLLDDKKLKKLVETGSVYNEYRDRVIEKTRYSIVRFPSEKFVDKKSRMLKKKAQYRVALVMYGCPNVSQVGKYIVETVDCDFCMIWKYDINRKQFVFSLRSGGLDIGEIAKSLGGGGHRQAAAFSMKRERLRSLDELFDI